MKYRSSRGGNAGSSFQEALFSGFTPDGGIFMPESIPVITKDTLSSWRGLTYTDIVKRIVSLFVSDDDIPASELNAMLDRAMRKFSIGDVVKLCQLDGGINILELFYGKTWAFKDLAMSCIGEFLQYYLKQSRQHVNILVGTSGDTGSSAIEAVRGLPYIDITVLYPSGGRCSELQELQMTTVTDDNVHVFAVDGTSDDLDQPIKECFADDEFVRQHNLISINSINWGRIMVQIAHHVYAYLCTVTDSSNPVTVVVPTGAAGNITAGMLAIKMGVPIKLVSSVNVNDIIQRTLTQGDFTISDHVTHTLASAMDIQIPYNMERLWYLVTDGDVGRVKELMVKFESSQGRLKLPDDIRNKLREHIDSFTVTDEEIKGTMLRCWQQSNGYIMCPHTATAVTYHSKGVHSDTRSSDSPVVYIATASPQKFPEAVSSAGIQMVESDAARQLYAKQTRYKVMSAANRGSWTQILKDHITKITSKWQDTT